MICQNLMPIQVARYKSVYGSQENIKAYLRLSRRYAFWGFIYVLRSSLLEFFPVRTLGQLFPFFVLGATLRELLLVMTVGSLLNVEIIPCGRVRIIGPLDHAGEQISCGVGQTLEHTVNHRHNLRTADKLVRLIGTVGQAQKPAVSRCNVDLLLCPVAG